MEILVHEVGLRDGLQMEKSTVPTETKLQWIADLLETGIDILQPGSFVHPKLVPQMADSDLLFAQARRLRKGSTPVFSGLVLNEKGLDRALDCGVELLCMGVSASETHSRKNTRMGTDEALSCILGLAGRTREAGLEVQVSVQSAFGCGFEGPIPESRVISIVERYLEAGLDDISLADTAGHADPVRVRRLVEAIRDRAPAVKLTCHFHDTYGLAMANCLAALEEGVKRFESSVGGLGGCPFTAVAGGNVATEDLVHLFQRLGYRHDIELDRLIGTARKIADHFARELPGSVYRAGRIPDRPPARVGE